ncbi:hypothetical protein Pve01_07160 [Planomonospora venezuelensis]|nr:hypothetical protein Pve01_07160 [Planomonospora venezuelensis]
MTRPVKVRTLTDREGRKLQRIVRRGTTSTVLHRFTIHRVGLEPGILRSGYAARWYSSISPPSTFRRSIRPSSGTAVRSS